LKKITNPCLHLSRGELWPLSDALAKVIKATSISNIGKMLLYVENLANASIEKKVKMLHGSVITTQ